MSVGSERGGRAGASEVESLLDQLDQKARQSGEGAKYAERSPRLRYRRLQTPLRWRRADGFVETFLHTRNLSVGGLGGLHSGELPLEARAMITLERLDGTPVAIATTIVHSQRFKDTWWNVGLKFDHPIKLEAYVREPASQGG